jgi:hypothetical protein
MHRRLAYSSARLLYLCVTCELLFHFDHKQIVMDYSDIQKIYEETCATLEANERLLIPLYDELVAHRDVIGSVSEELEQIYEADLPDTSSDDDGLGSDGENINHQDEQDQPPVQQQHAEAREDNNDVPEQEGSTTSSPPPVLITSPPPPSSPQSSSSHSTAESLCVLQSASNKDGDNNNGSSNNSVDNVPTPSFDLCSSPSSTSGQDTRKRAQSSPTPPPTSSKKKRF